MIDNRLNSCLSFAEGKCPHEWLMQRAYLIPELLSEVETEEYENSCLSCKQFVNHFMHLAESETDYFTPELATLKI